jgi:hypothetical protein
MLSICEQKIYVWSWPKSGSGWSALETTLMTHNGPISLPCCSTPPSRAPV